MDIKGIGFDYSGVVAGISSTFFSDSVCQMLNITKDRYRQSYFKFNHLANEQGLAWAEVWRMVVKDLDKEDQYDQLMEFINSQDKHTVNKKVLELIDTLRLQGYKVGLLSNNSVGEAEIMRANNIDTHFDTFLISEEINVSKPSKEAFDALFKNLNTKAEETIFIDDTANSLRNAEEIGYQPILFQNADQLIDDLEKLGVKI